MESDPDPEQRNPLKPQSVRFTKDEAEQSEALVEVVTGNESKGQESSGTNW